MEFNNILPILTLILGIALAELNYIFRTRREDRKNTGLVIAYLLEIRHRILGIRIVFDEVKSRVQYTPEEENQIQMIVKDFLPSIEEFTYKFNEYLDTISKFNPFLAFRLRSKDQFLPMMQKIRNLATLDNSSSTLISKLIDELSTKYIKVIEDILTELAKVHSFKTKREMKKYLKEDIIDDELKDIFSFMDKFKRNQ